MYAVIVLGSAAGIVGLATSWLLRRAEPTWRPVAVSPLLAAVWTGVCLFGGSSVALLFGWWCVCLTSIDLGSRRLPNLLTGVGAVAVGVYAVGTEQLPPMLLGAAGLCACYLLVHVLFPLALGAGDVKVAWSLGGVAGIAGADAWAVAALAAPLLTGACGAIASACGRRQARVPHGPAMCAATLLALAA